MVKATPAVKIWGHPRRWRSSVRARLRAYTRRMVGTRKAAPSAASLMKGLTAREQSDVLNASAIKELAAQQVLFHQDEPAEALYLVESGRLKLTQWTASGQAVTVRLVASGELCAAVAVLDGKTYP